jgi:surfeit locus 1 family protein
MESMTQKRPLYAVRERAGLWPLIAAVLGIAVTVALGTWQLGRAAEKRELRARFEALSAEPPIHVSGDELTASNLELRRVEARGVFDPRYTVFVDNRIHHGVPGYHVVMPLRIEGSDRYVLVNRGWIARTANRAELPAVPTPPTVVTVQGAAMVPRLRTLELSADVMEGPIWQNLTIDRYRSARPIPIQPFVIRQEGDAHDGLVREWEAPDFGIEKHYGYAFQWFALAATILVFYAVTRRRSRADPKT